MTLGWVRGGRLTTKIGGLASRMLAPGRLGLRLGLVLGFGSRCRVRVAVSTVEFVLVARRRLDGSPRSVVKHMDYGPYFGNTLDPHPDGCR